MFAFEVGFGRRDWFQIRAPCAANRLESARDVDAFVELFGFEEAIVGGVEVFAFDVETGEGEALARRFFALFLRRIDFAQAFAQFD